MEAYNVIIIIFGMIILLCFIFLSFYNRLKILQKKVLHQYFNVEKYVEEFNQELKKVSIFLENNFEHEIDYINDLKKTSMEIEKSSDQKEVIALIKKLKDVATSFSNLESTYSWLGKEKDYVQLKNNLTTGWNHLEYSLDSYNKAVLKYHASDRNKFYFFVKKLGRFPQYYRYE